MNYSKKHLKQMAYKEIFNKKLVFKRYVYKRMVKNEKYMKFKYQEVKKFTETLKNLGISSQNSVYDIFQQLAKIWNGRE